MVDHGSPGPGVAPGRRPRSSSRSWRERVGNRSFDIHLLLALVLVLVGVSAVRYELSTRQLERQVVTDGLAAAGAHAESMAQLSQLDVPTSEDHALYGAVLDGVVAGDDVSEAELYAADGTLLARASDGGDHGHHHSDHSGGATYWTNAASARGEPVVQRDGHLPYQFWVPFESADTRHVLHVGLSGASIERGLASLRVETLVTSAVIVVLAAVGFYLVAGRTLSARHRRALAGALRDSLTGLGNHRAFQEELGRTIARVQRSGEAAVCGLVDVDHFKAVNDRYGHGHGDDVLIEVGRVLARLRAGDVVFRIGGDEYAVILEHTDQSEAAAALSRVRESLTGATVSVGLCEIAVGDDLDTVLRHADTALYEAKRRGRDVVVPFVPEMQDNDGYVDPSRLRSLDVLLNESSMPVAFQPIFDLQEARPVGYEALIRPPADCGFSSPLQLFEVARIAGTVAELDALCRRSALDAFRSQVLVDDGARLFLNLSPVTLIHEPAFVSVLLREVAYAGLEPASIVVEVTERDSVDVARLASALVDLRLAGFGTALDDVGAGNTGLEILRRVPADLIKIDRQVIVDAMHDPASRGVLLAILTFAREMDSYVIAEGIEEAGQLDFVTRFPTVAGRSPLAIHGAQGFLLGRPEQRPDVEVGAAVLGRSDDGHHEDRLVPGT